MTLNNGNPFKYSSRRLPNKSSPRLISPSQTAIWGSDQKMYYGFSLIFRCRVSVLTLVSLIFIVVCSPVLMFHPAFCRSTKKRRKRWTRRTTTPNAWMKSLSSQLIRCVCVFFSIKRNRNQPRLGKFSSFTCSFSHIDALLSKNVKLLFFLGSCAKVEFW